VQLSDRQELLRSGRNLDRKMTPHHENHSGGLCSQGCSSQAQARLLTRFVTLQRRHHKLSRDTKIIKNRHRELRQPCAGKLTKVRKLCWKSDTFFHPGDHLRAQSLPNSLRVGPQVRNFKKEGNLSYDVQLSVRRQHLRFGRNLRRKNTEKLLRHPYFLGAITFPSKLRFAANLISLESRLLKLSNGTMHDPF
jgi:hypothetical protein